MIIKDKIVTHTYTTDIAVCDKCGRETPVYNIIDSWCKVEDEMYCLTCQRAFKVGLYAKK